MLGVKRMITCFINRLPNKGHRDDEESTNSNKVDSKEGGRLESQSEFSYSMLLIMRFKSDNSTGVKDLVL